MNKQVILIGNGGHAAVLTEILLQQRFDILGFTAPMPQENRFGIPYLGTDEVIGSFPCDQVELVLGFGSIDNTDSRKRVFQHFKVKGYSFATLIHRNALISPYATLGEGVQIMAGAVVQAFATIADNTIINTNASIDHDCSIGQHCHIAPGVTCSGSVTIGDSSHIGTGAILIQKVRLGSHVLVGSGSVVLRDIRDYAKAYGVPAKEVL
ncbi:acetyltransferase [Sporosarcina sp. 179-K 3D1 HS]|uniref:acetyltransferase n=1 Tax=Sporosarcina sp. 179-K 3D1 HS TaxID=3232169 RepID=UPI00399FB14D